MGTTMGTTTTTTITTSTTTTPTTTTPTPRTTTTESTTTKSTTPLTTTIATTELNLDENQSTSSAETTRTSESPIGNKAETPLTDENQSLIRVVIGVSAVAIVLLLVLVGTLVCLAKRHQSKPAAENGNNANNGGQQNAQEMQSAREYSSISAMAGGTFNDQYANTSNSVISRPSDAYEYGPLFDAGADWEKLYDQVPIDELNARNSHYAPFNAE